MLDLPDNIIKEIEIEIENGKYDIDHIGMSSDSILLFDDKVLKIREISEEAENEIQVMQWLEKRLPVPKIIAHERKEDKSYLLMTKAPGKMACDEKYMDQPKQLTELLAQALKILWQVDISDCPFDWSLDRKLRAASHYVENNLVDMENVEPDTFGENGFKDPDDLLQWLIAHRPEEELVLSHGDFCLPNIYIKNDVSDEKFTFLDLGRTGCGDKWCDIALCYRSLQYNYSGKYGGKVYPDYDPNMLFEKLGILPDWEKIRYYILLDELF